MASLPQTIRRMAVPLGAAALGGAGALGCAITGARTGAWAVLVLTGLLVLCDLCIRGARVLVRPGLPLFGMAGALLDEAIHRHLVRWTAGVVCVVLVALAFGSNAQERLDYAERFFIEWAQLLVEGALCVLTLVLSARSVAVEYAGKQIHTNLTKPVGRFTYLAGKWLGLMLINTVLLAVFALAMVLFASVIESRWSAQTKLSDTAKASEAQATHRTILTARFQTTPAMENPEALTGYFYERLGIMADGGSLEANDSVHKALQEARESGRWPAPETFKALLTAREYANCMELATGKWYTLGDLDTAQSSVEPSQVYVFSGLFEPLERAKAARARVEAQLRALGASAEDAQAVIPVLLRQTNVIPAHAKEWYAKQYDAGHKAEFEAMADALQADRLQLTLKPNAGGATPRQGMVELGVQAGGAPLPPMQVEERQALVKNGLTWAAVGAGHRLLPTDQPTSLDIPADRIDAAGKLKVRLTRVRVNGYLPQPTVLFDTNGGIKLYGPSGSFAPNVAAAFAVLLVKLGFLAMLGLVAGALFSFPVACMVAVAVYAFAAYSGGLRESFEDFTTLGHKPTAGLDYWLMQVKTATRLGMQQVLRVTPNFDAYNARTLLVDGVSVPWSLILECAGILGAVWTGGLALAGWFLFSRREIARVIV